MTKKSVFQKFVFLSYQWIFLGALTFLTATDAWSARQATLLIKSGKASVMKIGSMSWKEVTSREALLAQGDRVRTFSTTVATIAVDDGSAIELSPSSVVLVDFLESNQMRFRLDTGRLRAIVSKLISRQFSVVTKNAVCAVRGTEFDVAVDPSGNDTKVQVREGLVNVGDMKGKEIMLAAGESVSVTPEGLGDVDRGDSSSKKDSNQNKASDEAKAEVAREVRLDMSREAVEAAAALEMKNAVAQDGKTLIDAFGERVRVEQYLVRPAEDQISWVVLNTRDSSFNFSRWDIWANQALPSDLSSGFLDSLYSQSGSAAPSYWAIKDQWFNSNTNDYFMEARTGGNPVRFDLTVGNQTDYWWETIFDHRYTVMSDAGQTRLLSHLVSAPGVKDATAQLLSGTRGSSNALYACVSGGAGADCLDAGTSGSPNPAVGSSELYFYDYYEGTDAGRTIGDQGQQLQTITTVDVDNLNSTYASREGYFNKWSYYLDGQFVYDATGQVSETFDWNNMNLSLWETISNAYGTADLVLTGSALLVNTGSFAAATASNGSALVVTQKNYIINDEGKTFTMADLAQTFSEGASAQAAFKEFAEKANYEFVTEAPGFSSKLDLVVPMRILNALDASDDRPET